MTWENPWRKLATSGDLAGKQPLDADLTEFAAQANVAGDIIITDATPAWVRLAAGTNGQVLTLAGGLPSWATVSSSLFDSQQPTTDVAVVTKTGLSGYKTVLVTWAFENAGSGGGASVAMLLRARASAGTFRSLGTISAATNGSVLGWALITGFGNATEKVVYGTTRLLGAPATIDSSDALNEASGTITQWFSFPSWDESWDELELSFNGQNIEGSTADERGRYNISAW